MAAILKSCKICLNALLFCPIVSMKTVNPSMYCSNWNSFPTIMSHNPLWDCSAPHPSLLGPQTKSYLKFIGKKKQVVADVAAGQCQYQPGSLEVKYHPAWHKTWWVTDTSWDQDMKRAFPSHLSASSYHSVAIPFGSLSQTVLLGYWFASPPTNVTPKLKSGRVRKWKLIRYRLHKLDKLLLRIWTSYKIKIQKNKGRLRQFEILINANGKNETSAERWKRSA